MRRAAYAVAPYRRLMPLPSVLSNRRAFIALLFVSLACSRGGRAAPPGGATAPAGGGAAPTVGGQRGGSTISFDAAPLYRQMGMIARGLPFPLVGRTGFAATGDSERTHVVIALAWANTNMSFAREADNRFRANYTVSLALSQDERVIARADAEEQLLVGSYRETNRTDESVIHQEILDVPPGQYTLTVLVRDEGSQRSGQEQMRITVPRLADGSLSSPMPIAEVTPRDTRDSLPMLLLSPSGTVVAGRDSVIPVYLEEYGDTTTPIRLLVRSERGRVLWSDTVRVVPRGTLRAGVVEVPVSRIGIGVAQLTFVREGTADSSSAWVFVGFGGELPIASYDDMVSYLRHFAAPSRLQKLRDAREEDRPAAWAQFALETDGDPATPEHENLRAYFARVVRANSRFREDGLPGWLTDRGRVFITLGEPDAVFESPGPEFQRNRQQVWEYRELSLQLQFYDRTGIGQWRLTVTSESRFESEYRRRMK